jgi:hypothetical protein
LGLNCFICNFYCGGKTVAAFFVVGNGSVACIKQPSKRPAMPASGGIDGWRWLGLEQAFLKASAFCRFVNIKEQQVVVPNSDVQVWLDTQTIAGQMQIVPYVAIKKERRVNYRINVIRQGGRGNRIQISQSGRTDVQAATPTVLSRLAVGNSPEVQCSVNVVLRDGVRELGTYHFECAR